MKQRDPASQRNHFWELRGRESSWNKIPPQGDSRYICTPLTLSEKKRFAKGRNFIINFMLRYVDRVAETASTPLNLPAFDHYLTGHGANDDERLAMDFIHLLPLNSRFLEEIIDPNYLFSGPLIHNTGVQFISIDLKPAYAFIQRLKSGTVTNEDHYRVLQKGEISAARMLFMGTDFETTLLARITNIGNAELAELIDVYISSREFESVRVCLDALCPMSIITLSQDLQDQINTELVRIREIFPMALFLTRCGLSSARVIQLLELPDVALRMLNKNCKVGRPFRDGVISHDYKRDIAVALRICIQNCDNNPAFMLFEILSYLKTRPLQNGQLDAKSVAAACRIIGGDEDSYSREIREAAKTVGLAISDE